MSSICFKVLDKVQRFLSSSQVYFQKMPKNGKKWCFLCGNILPIIPPKNPVFRHYITDMHLVYFTTKYPDFAPKALSRSRLIEWTFQGVKCLRFKI